MNDLNKKLKEWGEQFTPEARDNEPIIRKIIDKIHTRQHAYQHTPTRAYLQQLFWTRIALAACVILLFISTVRPIIQPVSQQDAGSMNLVLNIDELDEIKTVVKEISRTFPEGVRWISKWGEEMDIQLGPSKLVKEEEQTNQVLITFHIVRKDQTGRNIVKRHDIIARISEPIESVNGEEMALWTYQVDEQHISIELKKLFRDKHYHIQIQDHFLQTFGEQNLIATTKLKEETYEVYQTAYRL